jgi:hypothetical protein
MRTAFDSVYKENGDWKWFYEAQTCMNKTRTTTANTYQRQKKKKKKQEKGTERGGNASALFHKNIYKKTIHEKKRQGNTLIDG